MKLRFLITLLVILLASCGQIPKTNPNFEVIAVGNDLKNSVEITLVSKNAHKICLDVEQWPNKFGQIENGSALILKLATGQAFEAKSTNFGFCPGGCGTIQIKPYSTLVARVGYDEFDMVEEITKLNGKSFFYSVSPFFCR